MPEMDGLELVTTLRDRQISIPAILITPDPTEGLRSRAATAGVPIVEKPFLGRRLFAAFVTRSITSEVTAMTELRNPARGSSR